MFLPQSHGDHPDINILRSQNRKAKRCHPELQLLNVRDSASVMPFSDRKSSKKTADCVGIKRQKEGEGVRGWSGAGSAPAPGWEQSSCSATSLLMYLSASGSDWASAGAATRCLSAGALPQITTKRWQVIYRIVCGAERRPCGRSHTGS